MNTIPNPPAAPARVEPMIVRYGRDLTRRGVEPHEQLAMLVRASPALWAALWRDLRAHVERDRERST